MRGILGTIAFNRVQFGSVKKKDRVQFGNFYISISKCKLFWHFDAY
jgi:hypothetical protein